MLNLLINILLFLLALVVIVCEWLFNAAKYFFIHIFPVLWEWFLLLLPWAGIPIAIAVLYQLREHIASRIIVYMSLAAIWWLTLERPPWLWFLAGAVLMEGYCLAYQLAMGLKARALLKVISCQGVLPAEHVAQMPAEAIDWAVRAGKVVRNSSGDAAWIRFLDAVTAWMDQAGAITQPELFQAGKQCAPQFSEQCMPVLNRFLYERGMLYVPGNSPCLIAPARVRECEHWMNMQGAATAEEFAALCNQSVLLTRCSIRGKQLADVILQNMVARGKVKKVFLDELGETLYVVKNPPVNSKLEQVELSLDD